MKNTLPTLTLIALSTVLGSPQVRAEAGTGVDEHTIALWLFDEISYGNMTLTDAGPHQIDLRLETTPVLREQEGLPTRLPEAMIEGRRGLVEGRFGNALHLPIGQGAGVTWPDGTWRRYGSASLFTRMDEVPEQCNLGYSDWTLELWFKGSGEQAGRGALLDLRNEFGETTPRCPPGASVTS